MRTLLKRLVLLVLALLVVGAGWLGYALGNRPSVDRYQKLAFTQAADNADSLEVTFLGVSTLLLRDGTAAVLVDGFFTRPGLLRTALGKIAPDGARIRAGLALAHIEKLDAVVAAHSHYDHAMDAADVAMNTGAVVVGSTSTANIARGRGLPEDRIVTVEGTRSLEFGDLTVTLIPSRHFPHGKAMGEIGAPLVPPVRALDYLEGGSFSILVERGQRSILVQSSAGFIEGALAGRHADVVYLGVGLLGSKDEAYREAYWRETVATVEARLVVPIHWDDFTRGLDEPLVALPYLLDNLDTSMDFVLSRARREGVDVRWPVLGMTTAPFQEL